MVRARASLVAALLLVSAAACGGEATMPLTSTAQTTTDAPTTTPAQTSTAPPTPTGDPATTFPPTTSTAVQPRTGPTIEITPPSGPSGTQFTVHATGCVLADRPDVAAVEAQIAVHWLNPPLQELVGVLAYNVPVRESSFTVGLDSGGWLHWVAGDEGLFYNGVGANPGSYSLSVECGDTENAILFTITDEPAVYLVNTLDFIPNVLAAPRDVTHRDLFTVPRGSGCVVDGTTLPDGVWFGFVDAFAQGELVFDLACLFTDFGAQQAAAADQGTTLRIPWVTGNPLDELVQMGRVQVYVRNRNPLTFELPVDPEASVWYVAPVSGTTIAHTETPITSWPSGESLLPCPGPRCGVWLYVNGGQVTSIVEQYLAADAAPIAGRVAAEWPRSWSWGRDRTWECHVMTTGQVAAGSVVHCGAPPQDPDDDGQYPVITVLVLDDTGTIAVVPAGVWRPLNVGDMEQSIGPGLSCAALLAEDSFLPRYIGHPRDRYFGVVLYWFVEGRPDRLDADGNGQPCEAEFLASFDTSEPNLIEAIIEDVWSGGWIGDSP